MGRKHGQSGESVNVFMELTGDYDSVVRKLRGPSDEIANVDQVSADLSKLVETVDRLGGGTRSAIADELPTDTAVGYDAEAVVDALQVLERYDLVVLEGNTWKPGPNLRR